MSLLLVTPKPSSPVSVHSLFTHSFATLLPNLVISSSDHFPILSQLDSQSPLPPLLTQISFRCIDAINIPHFIHDIVSSALIRNPSSSLSDLVDCYNFTLTNLLNKHAPLKTNWFIIDHPNPGFSS